MDNNFIWIPLAILLLVGIYFQERASKNRVREYLENKGCSDVKIRTRLFAGGKGVITFDVEYVDKAGFARKNSCIVHTGFFSDDKIYWQSALGKINEPSKDEEEDIYLWS